MKTIRTVLVVGAPEQRQWVRNALADSGLDVRELNGTDEALTIHGQLDASIVVGAGLEVESADAFARKLAVGPLPPPLILVGASRPVLPEGQPPYVDHVPADDAELLTTAIIRALRVRTLECEVQREVRSVSTIAEAQIRYREAFAAASDAIFMVEADGTILDANRSASDMSGRSVKELVGSNFCEFDAGGENHARAFLDRSLASATGLVEDTPFGSPGGRRLRVSISATPIEFAGARRLNLICRDITEAHARLVHAERLAILGGMLAGLAHEIKTPLAAISGNNEVFEMAVERVRERLVPLDASDSELGNSLAETVEILDDVLRTNKTASARLLAIVRSAKSFARPDNEDKESTDIHDGLDSSLILVAHETKGRIEVTKDYCGCDRVMCHPGQINQVFVNLLINAAHAIEGPGKIHIRTWEEGDEVYVAISDTGTGMSREVLERVFESGFTTKGPERGSGLGLSISNSIVQTHGGRIDVESRPGQGTTFTVVLPRTASCD